MRAEATNTIGLDVEFVPRATQKNKKLSEKTTIDPWKVVE
jgi:hypothetical protein